MRVLYRLEEDRTLQLMESPNIYCEDDIMYIVTPAGHERYCPDINGPMYEQYMKIAAKEGYLDLSDTPYVFRLDDDDNDEDDENASETLRLIRGLLS